MKTNMYNKLLLQAQEAESQGLNKLAFTILQAIGEAPNDYDLQYSHEDLRSDVYDALWKLVDNICEHYSSNSVDAEQLDSLISSFTDDFIDQVQSIMEKEKPKRKRLSLDKEEDLEEEEEEEEEEAEHEEDFRRLNEEDEESEDEDEEVESEEDEDFYKELMRKIRNDK